MLACCQLESLETEPARPVLRPVAPKQSRSRAQTARSREITAQSQRTADEARLRAAAQAFLLRVGS